MKKSGGNIPEDENKALLNKFGGSVLKRVECEKAPVDESKKIGFDPDYFIAEMTKLLCAVLALALVVYFTYHLIAVFSSGISTAEIHSVKISEYCSGNAIVIRDETVLKASKSGYLYSSFKDGDRVSKGEAVCRVYGADMSADAEEIERLDSELKLLNASIGAGVSATGMLDSYKKADELYRELMADLSSGNARDASAMSDSFRRSLNRLHYFEIGGDIFNNRFTELQNRRNSLASGFDNALEDITTPYQGYYYTSADGYESIVTTALLTGFTEDTFDMIMNAEPESTEKTAGKVAASSQWYLAVRTEGYTLEDFRATDKCEVTFTDCGSSVLEMTVESAVRTEEGIILLLSSAKEIPAPECGRFRSVDIKAAEYSGYEIPTVALHSYKDMTGVFTLHGQYISFRRVNIIYDDTGYCVVSPYSDFSDEVPETCYVLPYGTRGVIDNNASMREFAHKNNIYPRIRYQDKGDTAYAVTMIRIDSGIPVKYGYEAEYYYYLNNLETLIISGNNLYDGKVAD